MRCQNIDIIIITAKQKQSYINKHKPHYTRQYTRPNLRKYSVFMSLFIKHVDCKENVSASNVYKKRETF